MKLLKKTRHSVPKSRRPNFEKLFYKNPHLIHRDIEVYRCSVCLTRVWITEEIPAHFDKSKLVCLGSLESGILVQSYTTSLKESYGGVKEVETGTASTSTKDSASPSPTTKEAATTPTREKVILV